MSLTAFLKLLAIFFGVFSDLQKVKNPTVFIAIIFSVSVFQWCQKFQSNMQIMSMTNAWQIVNVSDV